MTPASTRGQPTSVGIVVGALAGCVASGDEEGLAVLTERFERVNEALREAGEPEHHEPRHLGGQRPWGCTMFSSDLWRLRRLAAHLRQAILADDFSEQVAEWPPPWSAEAAPNRENDPVLAAYYNEWGELWDQLFYHSDFEGLYLPVPMYDVLVPSEELFAAVGGQIGSSQSLLSDCEHLAKLIGLPLDLEPEGKTFEDVLVTRRSQGGEGWWLYGDECQALLKLANAARMSVELGAAIVFQG